jgi:hypothetical protein
MPGGWVAYDSTFVGGEVVPTHRRLATSNEYEEIPLPF